MHIDFYLYAPQQEPNISPAAAIDRQKGLSHQVYITGDSNLNWNKKLV